MFWSAFLPQSFADDYLAAFLKEIVWRQEDVVIYGKRHAQPRLIAWHGDPGRTYTYSRLRLAANPWTSGLSTLKESVEQAAGAEFNSVLLNLYRTGQDSIAWHADDEPELGPEPTIASVSLGATRRFRLRNRQTKKVLELPLSNGSLLVMEGPMQQSWVHEVPKEKGVSSPRVNLTFRYLH